MSAVTPFIWIKIIWYKTHLKLVQSEDCVLGGTLITAGFYAEFPFPGTELVIRLRLLFQVSWKLPKFVSERRYTS